MFPRRQRIISVPLLVMLIAVVSLLSSASVNAGGRLDSRFNPVVEGLGNTPVRALAAYANGKTLIAGDFTVSNGIGRTRLARLNADGSLDTSFNPGAGVNSQVSSIVIQPNGLILVCGGFTSVNGQGRKYIARLNPDGSVDTSFNDAGANSSISAVALQADGKILIGGFFSLVSGVVRNHIARLNEDGTLDASFVASTTNSVTAVCVQADGKIVIGGIFEGVNATARRGLARLNADGSLDASFNPGTGADSNVYAVALQPDGKVIVGGEFTLFNGVSRARIARLNVDGSVDASFNGGYGANATVYAVVLQADGKVVIGGTFTNVNGVARRRLARLHTDGTVDTSLDTTTGPDTTVLAVVVHPADGRITIGGFFTSINNVTRTYIGQLYADGSLNNSFNTNITTGGIVYAMALQPDGKAIIGGDLVAVNGVGRTRLARLNADGSLDPSFNPGTGPNRTVRAVALQPDGKIIVGGMFNSINGIPCNNLARLNADGSVDESFNHGAGVDGTVYSVALQPDGRIVIAGFFWNVDAFPSMYIARLNADGSVDTSFNVGNVRNGPAYAVAVQPDGKIIAGGGFADFNGVSRQGIARFNADGSLDDTFQIGTGAGNVVNALAIQPDGRIVLGGIFTTFNGVSRNNAARLNTDGSLDPSFNPPPTANSWVYAIAIQANGKVVLGSNNALVNGLTLPGIARFNKDGSPDASFRPGSGIDGTAYALAVQPDNKILIGGSFNSYNRVPHVGMARLFGNGSAAGDFDGDGRSDMAVWNANSGDWSLLESYTNQIRTQSGWGSGSLGDKLAPADYDGDGSTDIAVWRPSEGNWYIIQSSNGAVSLQNWGGAGDVPVAADYDGDGRADVAVFRPSDGNWYIRNSATNTVTVRGWGLSTDRVVPADYDGDGRADIGVFRPQDGNWYIINSATNTVTIKGWGALEDRAVAADYDGDGRADVAVFRPSTGNWHILNSAGTTSTVKGWGDSTDLPMPADYDGDGHADICIFRPADSAYYIIQSTTNTVRVQNLGDGSTAPVPNSYNAQ
ncbi:MAG TPA: FG-GAP-like repeat-containing protein [Pyrinomonadaceae bacterium]|jgi:uncharacterized delta-60 repeat protein